MGEGGLRILIVDDEPPILAATCDLLREYGHEVETLGDPRAIPERLAVFRADVLLQDVRMPGLDLRALVAALRADARTRDLHIVLFSAGVEAPALAKDLGLRVIEKPFRPQTLLDAIQRP